MTRTRPTPTRRLAAVRGVLADTRPLRTPAHRRLWLAATVTTIGSQLTVVAVPLQIYELTRSSSWVGLTGLFGLVPLVVFGLWGGAIADAVDRRTLLLVTVAGIASTSLLLFVTAATGLGGCGWCWWCSRCRPRSSPSTSRPAAPWCRGCCPSSSCRRPTR